MNRKSKWIVGAVISVALVGGGAGVAAASGGEEKETPITGSALEKASAAALKHTGGGKVTETEVGDEEGYYEVEVTLKGGKQVDVHLNKHFKVTGSKVEKAEKAGHKD
ncbi:hypothetical protein [Streptomyces sp. NPDC059460]|uniref:PepSY domain-containing protein n=1 Tax=Streptomyces sp. NPDC059460 TaxID=3346840 RepID=UPI00369ADB4E